MANGKFVAYYRVSTEKQRQKKRRDAQGVEVDTEVRGLGLDAQHNAVDAYLNGLKGQKWDLIQEFTEIESGKGHRNRPTLLEALALCKKHKATLIIAKLDRLSRNVAFLSNLMESSIEFVCCDNPQATKPLLHLMAVFAEMERDAISKRTKEALGVLRASGVKLGLANPRRTDQKAVAAKGVAAKKARAVEYASNVVPLIKDMQNAGISTLAKLAEALNMRGITSPRGGQWYAASVRRVLATAA